MVMNKFLNKVINGNWQDVVSKLPDNSIDLVVTDPPYSMNFRSNHRKVKHKKIENDDNLDWLDGWAKELKRVTKDDAHLYIFVSWHNIDKFKQVFEKYFNVKNVLIWLKNNTGMGDLTGDYAPQYEMILFISNGNKKLKGRRDSNVIKANRTGNELHPTQKPVNLIEYLIEKSSDVNDIVLDTFAGSFTTAVACKRTGRNFICTEIEPDYCNIGYKRLQGTSKNLF